MSTPSRTIPSAHDFRSRRQGLFVHTDRLLGWLLLIQLVAAWGIATLVTPVLLHEPHTLLAVYRLESLTLVSLMVAGVVALAWACPGNAFTRHAIAVVQMVLCSLFTDLLPGHHASHYIGFAALGMLAFYRDWRVLLSALLISMLDDALHATLWPEAFGFAQTQPFIHWAEHVGWLLLVGVLLMFSCKQSVGEMWQLAQYQEELLVTRNDVERQVEERTAELQASQRELQTQTERLRQSETQVRAILDTAADGIITVSEDGVIDECNGAAARLFGVRAQTVHGGRIEAYIPDLIGGERAGAGVYQSGVARILGAGRELIGRRQDGKTLALLASVSVVRLQGRRFYTVILRDLTERNRAQEHIRFQKSLLECQTEAAPDGIIVVSADHLILSVNRRFLDLWGIPPTVVIGRSSLLALDGARTRVANPDLFVAQIERLRQEHDETSHDEIPLLDGRVLESYSAPVKSETGEYYGRVWFYSDITDRKKAENDLRERTRLAELTAQFNEAMASSERLTEVLQQFAALFVERLDVAAARIWTVNEMTRRLELQGRAGEELALDQEPVLPLGGHPVGRVLLERQPSLSELGTCMEGTEAIYPLIVEGRSLGVIGLYFHQRLSRESFAALSTVVDALAQWLDRKRSSEELRASQVRKAAILEAALDAVVTIDHEGTILEFNGAAERIFGHTRSAVMGRCMTSLLIPEAMRTRHTNGLAHYLRTGEGPVLGKLVEIPALRADGTIFPAEVSVVPIHLEGQTLFTAYLRDITERTHNVAQLRASEARFRTMADSAPLLIWTAGADGNWQYVNLTWREFTGRELEQECGAGWLQAVHPEDRVRVQQEFQENVVHGTPFHREYRLLRKDGAYRWISEHVAPLLSDGASFTGSIGVCLDITERLQSETNSLAVQRLLDSIRRAQSDFIRAENMTKVFEGLLADLLQLTESEYGFIAEVAQASTGELRLNTQTASYVAWSSNLCSFSHQGTGTKPEFFNLEALGAAVLQTGESLLSNDPATAPWARHLPSGEAIPHAFLGLPCYHGGRVVAVLGIANCPHGYDEAVVAFLQPFLSTCGSLIQGMINERSRRQAERALVDRETRIRSIVETAVDGIIVLDRTGKVESFNPAAERIFGYTTEQIIGQNIGTLMPTSFAEENSAHLDRFRFLGDRNTSGAGREVTGKRSDGTLIPIELTISVMDLGEEVKFTGMVRDISERKRAKRELEKALVAAEASNRSKSAFLANMSHEVRTPMTAILGYTTMLLDDALAPAERVRSVRSIRRNGEHLLQLINDILDLSKIEVGKMELVTQPCRPWAVVNEALSAVGVIAEEKGLELRAEPLGVLPRLIHTDATRLRQILINLLGNAVKFTDRGKVELTLLVATRGNEPWLCFEVKDQGIGMGPDHVEGLFQPFSQVDPTLTRKFGGTGLGLTISRRLAEAMGGRIDVVSELGRGSIFTLRLPLQPIDLQDVVEANELLVDSTPIHQIRREGDSRFTGGRILLAEDNRCNQVIITHLLKKNGLEVQLAENGRIAVEMAQHGTFDVILMDMQMPEMDGYMATELLRSKGYRGPIVALTAHAMHGDEKKCLDAGCSGYLTKPVDVKRLLTVLGRWLSVTRKPAVSTPPLPPPVERAAVPRPAREAVIYSTYHDDAEFMVLVQQYVSGLPGQLQEMTTALAQQNFQQLARLAHKLKGSGGMYGYAELSEIAGLIEMGVHDDQGEEVLREFVADLTRTIEQIEAGLRLCAPGAQPPAADKVGV